MMCRGDAYIFCYFLQLHSQQDYTAIAPYLWQWCGGRSAIWARWLAPNEKAACRVPLPATHVGDASAVPANRPIALRAFTTFAVRRLRRPTMWPVLKIFSSGLSVPFAPRRTRRRQERPSRG
jgi:hypothetical protein